MPLQRTQNSITLHRKKKNLTEMYCYEFRRERCRKRQSPFLKQYPKIHLYACTHRKTTETSEQPVSWTSLTDDRRFQFEIYTTILIFVCTCNLLLETQPTDRSDCTSGDVMIHSQKFMFCAGQAMVSFIGMKVQTWCGGVPTVFRLLLQPVQAGLLFKQAMSTSFLFLFNIVLNNHSAVLLSWRQTETL